MAHFAELDDSNIVLRVIVISNDDIKDKKGKESESIGTALCAEMLGGRWIQASFSGSIRGRFPGVGWHYDSVLNEFFPPKPYPSWTWSEDGWASPIPEPDDGVAYEWNEDQQNWIPITE